jgi:hypothetical protein
MLKRYLPLAFLALGVAACSTVENSIGGLTVKDYKAKSGQRVMAGQAEPKSDFGCRKLEQEKQDFGLSGTMDKAAAIEKITAAAVERAPAKGANYAHIMVPSEMRFGGFNANAFKDAQVAYYQCGSLPAARS